MSASLGRSLPVEFQGAAPPDKVTVEGLEIVQSIQDSDNSVELIASKVTVVRVYLRAESAAVVQVRGELRTTRSGVSSIDVASLNAVAVDPADNGNVLKKRENAALSLNFVLPSELIAAGTTAVQLTSASNSLTGGALELTPMPAQSFAFQAGPPLRLRLLGIRYKNSTSPLTFVPKQRDIDLTLSWLRRAYPVPRVEATYAVVDSNQNWPFSATDVNLQLAAIRAADVAAGTDERTHYFGLVDDGNGTQFMRGRASDIPASADPSTVASGPTGSNSWGWDFDGSYGDWYTAHELGHTFGRFHPGFCNNNSSDDPVFPYPNGQLSGAAPAYIGFDVGDGAQGIPLAALPGNRWHDVMTYCDNQWLSAHTYEGIRQRLLAEDLQFAPAGTQPAVPAPQAAGVPGMTTKSPWINVIGWINLSKITGGIRYVVPGAPGASKTTKKSGPEAIVKLKDGAGKLLSQHTVSVTLESCNDAGDGDRMGIVNATVPSHDDVAVLELWFDDRKVDQYEVTQPPKNVANIRKKGPPPGPHAAAVTAPAAPGTTIEWDSPEANDPGITYIVQVRSDPQQPWQTISVGRTTPEVAVESSQFPSHKKLQVRVMATNGLHVTDVTESEVELD